VMSDTLSRDVLRETEAVWSRRLDKIERENEKLEKRLKLGSVALVLLFGVTVLLAFLAAPRAAGVEDSVQARQFVLRDGSGLIRGLWELEEGGGPRIILRDGDGRERVRMNLLADGSPGVTLADRDGRPRVVMGILPDGTTNLVFADAVGTTRAIFGHSSVDATTLMLADRAGTIRAGLVVDAGGEAAFTLYEDEQTAEATTVTPQ
jgi:hypothetical protein